MAKKLLMNEAAEKEANDIAERFMNSADVLQDMRAEYGSRLDGVQLHDDEEAQERVKAVRRDAVAKGRDIYFGRGILQSKTPEAKGLVAHEIAHTMQQDGMGGMNERVAFGEEQGGIRDWFRRRKAEKMQISAPQMVTESKGSSASRAIYEMVEEASPEQARDPMLQKLVLDQYNREMNARLMAKKGQEASVSRNEFRNNDYTKAAYDTMTAKLLPADFQEQLNNSVKGGDPQAVLGMVGDIVDQEELNESGQDVGLGQFMARAYDAFSGTDLADDRIRSAMLMNSLMLRTVSPMLTEEAKKSDPFSEKGKADRAAANGVLKTANRDFNNVVERGQSSSFSERLMRRFRGAPAQAAAPAQAPAVSQAVPDHETMDEDIPLTPEQERNYRATIESGFKIPRRLFASRV